MQAYGYQLPVGYPGAGRPHPGQQRKQVRKHVHSRAKKHASYFNLLFQGLIVMALIFGIIQAARSVVSNAYQLSLLSKNLPAVERYHQKTVQENRQLLEKIQIYSSPSGIEELARNNLGLVGEDEILVRFY